MSLVTRRIFETQLAPVLRRLTVLRSETTQDPRRTFNRVAREVAAQQQVHFKTIRGLFIHRLGFGTADALYRVLADWARGDPSALGAALRAHVDADQLGQVATLAADAATPPPRLRDDAQAAPSPAPPDERVVILRDLDPDMLFALRSMARQSGRTIEAEIRDLIAYAFRAKRQEFIEWADTLRGKLAGRYHGDSTADIRADRDSR